MTYPINIGIVDDHPVFCNGLELFIKEKIRSYSVTLVAYSGFELFETLRSRPNNHPDIILMDIDMKPMNGIEATHRLWLDYPQIKVLPMTSIENESTLRRIIAVGACGYLTKSDAPEDLQVALDRVSKFGFYYSKVALKIMGDPFWQEKHRTTGTIPLSKRERVFVNLSCSDLTYKEIADRMNVSENTIRDYRMHVFQKLRVKSRSGMIMHAFMYGLV